MISVIVPVNNVESYLKECLSSVLDQSYKDLELICVDDGSTDSSLEIIKYFSEIDNRVILISHPKSLGVSAARNAGLNVARGEFVFFLDSDDYLLPGSLERMCRLMTPDVDAVVSSVKCIYEKDSGIQQESQLSHNFSFKGKIQLNYEQLFQFNKAVFPKLFRRNRIKDLKLSFPDGLLWEDNLWHWIYFSNQPIVYFDPIPAYCYRKRAGSIMSSVFKRNNGRLSEHFDIFRHILQFYKSHSLIEKANISLVKLLEFFLLFCLQYASLEQSLICCYKCKKLLSDYELDISTSWVLTQLKSEECCVFLCADSDLDFVIKINKLAQLLFPKNSSRRRLFCFILQKMKKLTLCFK